MTKPLNDSLDNLFAGDTGPARRETALDRPAAAEYHANIADNPGYYQKCPRCNGTGQTRWGACFKCKGARGRTFKTSPEARAKASEQYADRKARREADVLDAWKADNRQAYEWLVANAPRWDVAQSLLDGLRRYGSLTVKQLAIVERGIARDAEKALQNAQRGAGAPAVDTAGIDRLKAAFDQAVAYSAQKGLKLSPRITIGGITISPAKATSANPGALYVKASGVYLGKIKDGRFFYSNDCSYGAREQVQKFIADPVEAAKVYGQTTGTCCICNATLRSEWKHRGIGPVCAEKFGW